MTFKKGDPRPANSGRRKGSANKTGFDVKAALRLHGPELAAELVRLALHAKNEATRTLAIRECFDRMLGKPTEMGRLSITRKMLNKTKRVVARLAEGVSV